MRILYLTGTDPRSMAYGGEQRTHFIWEGLKKIGEVYTVIPVAHKSQEKIEEMARIRWVCFEKRWTMGWCFLRIWARYSPLWVIKWPCFFDRATFARSYPFAFDACVTRYVGMASYLQAWKIAPLVIDVDDLLTAEFDSFHPLPHTPFNRVLRWILECYQTAVFKHARHLWVSDPVHMRILDKYSVSYVPNIPCALRQTFKDTVSESQMLFFVGALNCSQSYDGVDYFLSEYWNDLLVKFPQLQFKIAGGGLPSEFKNKWVQYRNVEVLGFVKDLHPYYEQSMAFIAPLYKGTGSCIKVVEALFAGRVCIGTPHALRGIQTSDWCAENGIIVFHDKTELMSAVGNLVCPENRKVMQIGGKQFVQRCYTQQQVDESVAASLKITGQG